MKRSRKPTAPATAITVCLNDVVSDVVRWIDRGRIPLGKPTVLDGNPGLGKSTLLLDIAARVSTGRTIPDGGGCDLEGPAGVVILSAEDGLADTIRPRLEAAGADLTRIRALTRVRTDEGEALPTLLDIAAIRQAIEEIAAQLVIIDPLMAYLPSETDSHRDQDVRRIMAELAKVAEGTGAAIVIVRHLRKSSAEGNPLYAGGGSIGIIGAVRSGLLVAEDQNDDTRARRVIASTKCNLAAMPPALAFHLRDTGHGVAAVIWDGPVDMTAADLIAPPRPARSTALGKAVDFLENLVADGAVHPAEYVLRSATAAGISERTLDRARTVAAIEKKKIGGGGWVYRRPGGQDRQVSPNGGAGGVGGVGGLSPGDRARLEAEAAAGDPLAVNMLAALRSST